ncbi:putative cytoplasmic protein [Leminorella grimontii ATCC 33999 = DSM 5078]|nr:putative cytoplasmic protein [Leminorella grimontii ATCC 33999 = DSM 5078]
MKLSVLQRLPQFYHWYGGEVGSRVEASDLPSQLDGDRDRNNLLGLKLLSYSNARAWDVMYKISLYLKGIDIENSVIEVSGEPCLFIRSQDEAVALCRLKSMGIAIADFIPHQPFC